MPTVAGRPAAPPVAAAPAAPAPALRLEASASGGVLVLAQAWAVLGGPRLAAAGVRWQGPGAAVLLCALVVLPVLAVDSVRAVAALAGTAADPLWRGLGWGAVLTQRRLARFVASPRHDWWGVLAGLAAALARHAPAALGPARALAVDSTTIEKRHGPRLPERAPVYDSIQKKLVDGYAVVSAAVVGPRGHWPLGLVPHRPLPKGTRRRRKARPGEAPSKLDLALRLVPLGVAAGAVGAGATVLGDSAFCVNWWLGEVAALGGHWLVATRHDRRLRIGAAIQPVRAWASPAPLALVATEPPAPPAAPAPAPAPAGRGRRRPRPATTVWGALLPVAVLLDRHCDRRGLPCRPAYFERRDHRGAVLHRWYLVTSHLDWDLAALWTHWQWRWAIEVVHRTSKQWLHLAAFHVRTWEGIVALVVCSGLRASLLAFVRAAGPGCRAYSSEALVARLRTAACVVGTAPDGTLEVRPPATLPAPALWPPAGPTKPPVPPEWWPLALRAA